MLITISNDKFKYHNLEMFRDPGVHEYTVVLKVIYRVRPGLNMLDLKFFEWSNYLFFCMVKVKVTSACEPNWPIRPELIPVSVALCD